MKKTNNVFRSIFLSIFLISLLLFSQTVQACSGFVVQKDGEVLIGHNKDWWNPESTIYVYPSEQDKYARLFIEIPFPHPFNNEYRVLAGGINEKGLSYESFVTPFNLATFELFKPPLFKSPVDYILQHYSTVDEVINYISSHNLFFLNYILAFGQLFVVDSTGDAAIIEGNDIIRIQGEYQVCTNFLQSDPSLGNYPCWRYQYLVDSLESNSELSISHFKSLLQNVELYAQYSWILNPNNLTLSLYHFHDYGHVLHLNLSKEFDQPAHTYDLPSLFEPNDNVPPHKPQIPNGPITGKRRETLYFETNTVDPDNDIEEIYYKWDFDDGSTPSWVYNYKTNRGSTTHTWKKPGTYSIRVKAKDVYGNESPWSDPLEITITSRIPFFDFFNQYKLSSTSNETCFELFTIHQVTLAEQK